MSEYKNTEGWEASQKTLDYWRFIPMKINKDVGIDMPPLFKRVNPAIRWLIIGFLGIFLLEGYATFAVAMVEGVPIEVISLLILIDVFLAVLPHLLDGKRIDLKNHIFIGNFSTQYLKLDEDEKEKYQASLISNENKLKKLNVLKFFLYLPIIISGYVKLWLFFSQYPFYDTYQAYIVFTSYTLGCFLHIICTGHVIMYWRFRMSLKKDRDRYGNSSSKANKIETRPDKLINPKEILAFSLNENQTNQKIVLKDSKYYLHFEGVLFDEEINVISQQDSLKQQMAVALTGKIIQTKLLESRK